LKRVNAVVVARDGVEFVNLYRHGDSSEISDFPLALTTEQTYQFINSLLPRQFYQY
jgi:hypothetical protein